VVRDWIERRLGPAGQLERAGEGIQAIGRLANELPRLAERAERLSAEFDRMGEKGIRLDPETIEGIGRSEARAGRWGRVALWVIAVVAVIAGLSVIF
jgi:ubiquinone biosynthesis protein